MTSSNNPVTIEQTQLADRLAIMEATSNIGLLLDARSWDDLENLFFDPVLVDTTSVLGGVPESLAPSELVGQWRNLVSGLDAIQHMIGSHVVTINGREARCTANIQATHVLDNSLDDGLWTVGGRWEIGFTRTDTGWRISAFELILQWTTGNHDVMVKAAQRANER